MENNLFMEIDNYWVYVTQVLSMAEKETFKIAVKELVQAINAYTEKVANIFSNVEALLSTYPKGIDYNDSKECSKVDWFYNTLEFVFKELDKKNSLDAAYFYIAMRDYVKETEKTRFKDSIEITEG
jgi:hypothetical protein